MILSRCTARVGQLITTSNRTSSVRASARSSRAASSKRVVSRRLATNFVLGVCALNIYCTGASDANAETCMDLKTSSTGLQYCDISVGDGKEPVKGQKIEAHYIGKLTNGKKFDASYDRGRPLPFNVGAGQVIKGWDLGILGADDIPPMKVGGKRRLLIPPQLGYGDRGAGGVIPGGATLDFEVELVKA
ncbi:FKBP-type peptidyl-prolyl cis-trans isomerase [Chloropicon roscoffensis]|uniref:peptidylprolyl isomerase n=2 Tax=Chloropicon roscoffensis TaxID=1461544 RepID=A0AAX4P4W8_9CHLO